MRTGRLFWKLYPSYFLVTLLALFLAGWVVSGTLRSFYTHQVHDDLLAKTLLIKQDFYEQKQRLTNIKLAEKYCKLMGRAISTRITVILPDGRVVCDSERAPATMDNHSNRPEVIQAMAGAEGSSIRHSHTLNTDMMYVASPLIRNGKTAAIIRVAMSLDSIDTAMNSILEKIVAGGVLAVLLTAFLSFIISRRISGPLEELTAQVQQAAGMETGEKVVLTREPSLEVAVLVQSINSMIAKLRQRMLSLDKERRQLQAILAGMTEGVITVDSKNRVVMMNPSAGRLLDKAPESCYGQTLEQVIGHSELLAMINNACKTATPMDQEITLENRMIMQVHAVPLQGDGTDKGMLIVLNNITGLRKMEQMRKDFVANVSHELKTPITAIQGFAETLIDGAMNDADNAERFLRIIATHAQRMGNLVRDLLTLARLDQVPDAADISMEVVSVEKLVAQVETACEPAAKTGNISIETNVEPGLKIKVNQELMEQALINLVDNAIKYSKPGSSVKITVKRVKNGNEPNDAVEFMVQDHGCGIPPEHIPRLFERFYRVDKSRSRKLGGTGLGLAIVKHVTQVHNGIVKVDSLPGRGSVFSILIPG